MCTQMSGAGFMALYHHIYQQEATSRSLRSGCHLILPAVNSNRGRLSFLYNSIKLLKEDLDLPEYPLFYIDDQLFIYHICYIFPRSLFLPKCFILLTQPVKYTLYFALFFVVVRLISSVISRQHFSMSFLIACFFLFFLYQ